VRDRAECGDEIGRGRVRWPRPPPPPPRATEWTYQGICSVANCPLNSSVALVTGAASGIGQAIALGFIREGCRRIILVDLNSEGLQETKQLALEIGSDAEVLICPCDISDEAAVNKVMETGMAKFKRLDYAVNCAGFPGGFAKTAEYVLKDFDRVQEVNVRGTWLCMKSQIQQMKKQAPLNPAKYSPLSSGQLTFSPKIPGQKGSIVNIASTAGLVGIKNLSGVHFPECKWGLTIVCSVETCDLGIHESGGD
jgi:NAD(P)-dependent dehydrogenase (short-subunit alcohol dehydrogenase family)